MNRKISERTATFGCRDGLVGIVTQPAEPDPSLPAVIALNSGIVLRSGQGRIYVTMARRLAAMGYRFLRFDMSGIGDSLTRGDGVPPVEAAIEDVREALDWFVGDKGRVVVIGLCDGATLAAHRASIDPRVVGAMLIDPLIPPTARYRRLHVWNRLMHFTTWRELANGSHPLWRMAKSYATAPAAAGEHMDPLDADTPEIRAGLQAVYQGLMDNEVETFAIFTGGMQHRHCYREQLLDAFPSIRFTERLRLEYIEGNDHHLEWPPHRAWLLDTVVEWLASAPFRGAAGQAASAAPTGERRGGGSSQPSPSPADAGAPQGLRLADEPVPQPADSSRDDDREWGDKRTTEVRSESGDRDQRAEHASDRASHASGEPLGKVAPRVGHDARETERGRHPDPQLDPNAPAIALGAYGAATAT